MLGTLTPMRAGVSRTALRNFLKVRNIEVAGTAIVLRDYASSYSIDLSGKSGGSLAFTLDLSQTHPGNHEVESFEIVLITPAVNPPAVTFPFISRWADFAGLWRIQPGRAYFISVFRTAGGDWIGAVAGEVRLRTKRRILGRTGTFEAPTVELQDDIQVYRGTIDSAETVLAFSAAGLKSGKSVLCFDLILDVTADQADVTFPVSGWFDFCYPARGFKKGETHAMTFLSLDGGSTWTGRWNNYLK